jgi:hypothetical protein
MKTKELVSHDSHLVTRLIWCVWKGSYSFEKKISNWLFQNHNLQSKYLLHSQRYMCKQQLTCESNFTKDQKPDQKHKI